MPQDVFRATGECPFVVDGFGHRRTYVIVRPAVGGEVHVFALLADAPGFWSGTTLENVEVLTAAGRGYVFPRLRVVEAVQTDLGTSLDAVNDGPMFEWSFETRRRIAASAS